MTDRPDWEDEDWVNVVCDFWNPASVERKNSSEERKGPAVEAAPANDFESTHPAFLERLANSDKAVNAIGAWCGRNGKKFWKAKLSAAPTRAEAEKFSDHGDIRVDDVPHEVKGLTVSFTGPGDWPFKEDFIVDGVGTYEKKKPKPAGYYIVSSTLTHAAYVDARRTRPYWTKAERFDKNVQRNQPFFFVPITMVEWFALGSGAPAVQPLPATNNVVGFKKRENVRDDRDIPF